MSPLYNVDNGVISTDVTGEVEVTRQISDQAEKDLARADLLTAPLTFVALVVVFGSLVAAGLPLAVGILAVLGTFVVLKALAQFTDVSVFSLNLTTGMGLGLAIDYSLFVVSRYREELGRGVSPPVAVGRSMQTAGRTVAFSAGTVAISLAVLAIFPMPYLRSFSYAGVAVVALAAFSSIVVLPSVLAVLGPRIEKGRIFKVRDATDGGFWRHQADRVMRHPVPYALAVSLVLILLAIPFFHVDVGLPDDRVGPEEHDEPGRDRRSATQLRKSRSRRIAGTDPERRRGEGQGRDRQVRKGSLEPQRSGARRRGDRLLRRRRRRRQARPALCGPASAPRAREALRRPAGRFRHVSLGRPERRALLARRREAGKGRPRRSHAVQNVEVAGLSAQLVDTKHAVISRLPIAIGFIALATFVLLFMMTGSILVPVKALALNMLSLTATFGATVWIFQDGHLSDLLGFTPTGTIDVFTPILMFCIAFGLSMDYEVFLLSRIKEEYDLEHDNEHAVAIGLAKTGRIVTAAALLLTIVFAGIATSQVALLKAFGIGLALAVLVDAFLIRATLVPAFMRLAGRLNWWSPKWLRRWHLRFGIWENEPIALLDRQFESSV